MGYKYFDTPDGEDCDKKLMYTLKKAGIIGGMLSTGHVLMVEHPKGYVPTLARFAKITGPCLAAAATGTITICLLVGARKVDDEYNHFWGGYLGTIAGSIVGGGFGLGVRWGVFVGMAVGALKNAQLRNYELVTTVTKHSPYDFWTKDYDLSVVKKRPADWIAK